MKHKIQTVGDIVGNTMPLYSVVCITSLNKYSNKEDCLIAIYKGDKYSAEEYYLRKILVDKNISKEEINEFIKELNNSTISKYYSTMWKKYNVLIIAKECIKTENIWSIEQMADKRLHIEPHYNAFIGEI
ncbi:MAG TPA: hypothetical protein PK507_03115 [bacterium]|jgi:hypothetical protein|nr:hypothetical protein [bacterium]